MSNYIVVGGSELQKDFIEKVRANGFTAHVVDYDPHCVGKNIADHFHCLSIDDRDGVLGLGESLNIIGISTVATEQGNITANYVAERLGLVGNGLEVALNTTDKSRMKQVIAENGIASPASITVLSKQELMSINVDFPVVVKASDRSAGRGVALANNHEELNDYYEEAFAVSFNKKVLVEEYIDGTQYSLETISFKGRHEIIAITAMGFSGPPHFVETTHRLPASIGEDEAELLRKFAHDCLRAFNVQNGASHIEVRMAQGIPHLIELASRMGGWRHWMIAGALGIDYLQLLLDTSLGKSISFSPMWQNQIAVSRTIATDRDYEDYLKLKRSEVSLLVDFVKKGAPRTKATNLVETHGFYIALEDFEDEPCQ